MARFTEGWIRFERRVINEDIGQNGHILAVFVTLLAWACRFETKRNHGGEIKVIPPGSVIFGIRELADHLGFSKDTVYRALKYLKNRDTISVTSDTRGTIVTFCNWSKYQIEHTNTATPERQELRHDPDTTATPARHEPTRIGQGNKVTSKQETKKTNVGIRTEYPQDFEHFWLKYKSSTNRRMGDKKKALAIWNKLKLTEIERALLNRAIDKYMSDKEVWKKDFSSFLNTDWRDQEFGLEAGNAQKPSWMQDAESEADTHSWDEGEAVNG